MKKILPLLAVVLVFVGCSFSQREVSVKDVTKSETIILKKKPGQGSISSIHVVGRSSINGKAEVQLILNGAVYKRAEVSGDSRFEWSGDWYADEAEVRYIPGSASSGTLTLKYDLK